MAARGRIRWLPAAIGVYAGLTACAIKIDHSLIKDGAADLASDRAMPDQVVDRVDQAADADSAGIDAIVDAARDGARDAVLDQKRDVRPPDMPKADLVKCTPSAVLGCSADGKSLVRCNASGVGTYLYSCGAYQCVLALKRCSGCDPAQPPTCSGSSRVTCSALGLPSSVLCPLGCQGGSCCADGDGDGYSGCAGDCNDSNGSVHPNQTTYFVTPVGTSFDYNCDGKADPEFPSLASCHFDASSACVGAGWESSVPACGATGSFVGCKKTGPSCIIDQAVAQTQACR